MEKKKKRVIIFHPALAPYRVDFFNTISKYFDATFYFFETNVISQQFDQEKLKLKANFQCNYLSNGFKIGKRSIRFGLLKIINRTKAEIVFVSEFNITTWFVILGLALKKTNFKIVSICDDNLVMLNNQSFLKRINRRFQLNYLDALILTDNKVAEWYQKKYETRTKYLSFPIIHSENTFRTELKESLLLSNEYINRYNLTGKKILLFVGRLVKVKNIPFLLNAFNELNSKYIDTVLVIVGGGDEEEGIHELAKELNLNDSVLFVGRKEGLDLLSWYNVASIFVLPSMYEPFGAVVNEALLAGCYTLCSDKAGAKSLIIESKNGEIFDSTNQNELVDKMEKAIYKVERINPPILLRKSLMKEQFDELLKSPFKNIEQL